MWRWVRRQWYSLPQSARQIILTAGTLWFFIQFGGALLTGLFWFGVALCGLYLIRALRYIKIGVNVCLCVRGALRETFCANRSGW